MIPRLQLRQAYTNADWSWLKDKGLDGLAYITRLAVDYGFAEQVAQNKVKDNESIRQIQTMAAVAAGAAFPPAGAVLEVINLLGLDLSAIGNIGDSATARRRLIEWRDYMINGYANNSEYSVMFNHALKNLNYLINARPKCMSPSPDCSKEHAQYLIRANLVKESQAHDFYMLDHILDSDDHYLPFINSLSSSTTGGSGGGVGGGGGSTQQPKTAGIGALALLALPFLFWKR